MRKEIPPGATWPYLEKSTAKGYSRINSIWGYFMSYTATVFKVMIASPSDVSPERAVVRERLAEWNIVNSDSKKTVLLPIGSSPVYNK